MEGDTAVMRGRGAKSQPELSDVPVRLLAEDGLEPRAMVASLAAHTVPAAERTDSENATHQRLIHTVQGPVAVSVHLGADGVDVVGQGISATDEPVLGAIRVWLDLDADLVRVHSILARDPLLRPLVLARPALRVIGTTDSFQTAVTTVLGQQVSLAAGRTFAGRLVAAYGAPGPSGLRQFPDSQTLAAADVAQMRAAIGLTESRARTVKAVAGAFSERGHPRGGQTLPLTRDELLGLPGVGPWTADYIEVRTGNQDAFTPGDLVLRRALGGITSRAAANRAEAWRPFRAYALAHLWTATAYVSGVG